ncbi:hypothetical protein PMI41_04760 [Phyllobacterium sp. YR531]|nr:hypothetical protein PMI41_04760 [Phyllobacterium sp. YR531]
MIAAEIGHKFSFWTDFCDNAFGFESILMLT